MMDLPFQRFSSSASWRVLWWVPGTLRQGTVSWSWGPRSLRWATGRWRPTSGRSGSWSPGVPWDVRSPAPSRPPTPGGGDGGWGSRPWGIGFPRPFCWVGGLTLTADDVQKSETFKEHVQPIHVPLGHQSSALGSWNSAS